MSRVKISSGEPGSQVRALYAAQHCVDTESRIKSHIEADFWFAKTHISVRKIETV